MADHIKGFLSLKDLKHHPPPMDLHALFRLLHMNNGKAIITTAIIVNPTLLRTPIIILHVLFLYRSPIFIILDLYTYYIGLYVPTYYIGVLLIMQPHAAYLAITHGLYTK